MGPAIPAALRLSATDEEVLQLRAALEKTLQERGALMAERDLLKKPLAFRDSEHDELKSKVARLESEAAQAGERISAPELQVENLASEQDKAHTARATVEDSKRRDEAEILLGETASRIDRRVLDYVWPGVRSEAHSRVKTTAVLASLLADIEGLPNKGLVQGPRRLKQTYGWAAERFLSEDFTDEAAKVRERWDSVAEACDGFFALLQSLMQFRTVVARPDGNKSVNVQGVIDRLEQLGNCSEQIEELQDVAKVEAYVNGR